MVFISVPQSSKKITSDNSHEVAPLASCRAKTTSPLQQYEKRKFTKTLENKLVAAIDVVCMRKFAQTDRIFIPDELDIELLKMKNNFISNGFCSTKDRPLNNKSI